MDINQIYSGDPAAVYTNIKPLCYLPETNVTLYFNYICIYKETRKNLEGHTA